MADQGTKPEPVHALFGTLALERRDGGGSEDGPIFFLLLSISGPYYSQVLIPQNNYAIAD